MSSLSNVLSLDGMKNVTADELQKVSEELGLEKVAYAAASQQSCYSLNLPEIASRAALLALRSAARNFLPNGKPYTLGNYLKRFTTLWARRLATNLEKGKALPIVDLKQVLAEIQGQHVFEQIVRLPEPTNMEDEAQERTHETDCRLANDTLAVVEKVLQEGKLSFLRSSADSLRSTIECGGVVCTFWFKLNGPDLGVLACLPVFANTEWMMKVAVAMNQINWKLLVGNFEMDPEDGEMRFRATLPLHGALPTLEQVHCIFGSAYGAIKEYGRALIESALTDHDNDFLLHRAEEQAREESASS